MHETKEKFKVWITKYALTQGIYPVEVELCDNADGKMVSEVGSEYHTVYYGEGRDWHKTEAGAIEYAKKMRDKKVASMKKAIKKLEAMTFE